MDVHGILEDEWYLVRHSGETPEIALHSALYFLTRSKDGPHLKLNDMQLADLQAAAVERFYEIITRDIIPANVGTPGYRGIERAIVNYQRYLSFLGRQSLENTLRESVGRQLIEFLSFEYGELLAAKRESFFNISLAEISVFSDQLGVDCRQLLDDLQLVLHSCLSH